MSDLRGALQDATQTDLNQIDTDLQLINRSVNTAVTALNNITNALGRLSSGTLGTPPATATSQGIAGTIIITNGFIYACIATNTWQRVAIATF